MNNLQLDPDQALAELCRRSFYRFVQEFWGEIIPETPVWNWHIKYLCDELQKINDQVVKRKPKLYDLIINIPPGSTKSTIATQMYNAYVWTVDPAQRIITSSYSQALSLTHSIKTRDIIASDKYRRLFPEVKLKVDQQAKTDFRTTEKGQRFTTSTGGSVTGMHAHQIIIDDPINPLQASSTVERENANTFVGSTLSTRKIDKEVTPTILIMQRLHEYDPTGMLLSKQSASKPIKHICLPAELADNVRPLEIKLMYKDGLLDPVRLSKSILAEARTDLQSFGYAGQFAQNPVPAEGGIFKKDWFEVIDWQPEYAGLKWDFVADTAYTKDEMNDPSGYLSYTKYHNDFIIRFAQTDYLEFPELCKAIQTFAQAHGYSHRSMIEIEPKASGKSLHQTLKRTTGLNVKEGKPPAKDKVARANDSAPTVEAGRVKLIRGHWNGPFVEQICTFPNAQHDEFVDCLTMMIGDGRKKRRGIRRAN